MNGTRFWGRGLIFILITPCLCSFFAFFVPVQFSINYGSSPDSMVIGWLTADMTAASTVFYGTSPSSLTQTATGTSDFYKYSAKYTSGLIHHTTLTGLNPATTYYYQVGQAGALSQVYSFKSNPGVGPIFPYTTAYIADVGENNNANQTITNLLARMNNFDSVVINGDIAYASGCESTGCVVWDAFQRMVQPVTASKSFSVNLGNHECYDTANGITAISARYRYAGMPYPAGSQDDVFYFSWEAGPIHYISVSSFFPDGYGANSRLTQWLQKDLAAIDRSKTPFVLVTLHAPWYNSNTEHQGDGEAMRVALEPMLLAAGVNAVFAGHVHAAEFSAPVANNQVDPAGITHFNIGDGGASLYKKWIKNPASWSLFRDATWGHGEFTVHNATHATWNWFLNTDNSIGYTYDVINTHTA
jgi:hypothetical protein